jgi:hypothetical protein
MQDDATAFMDSRPEEGFESYRSVSKPAVLSVILGLMSLIGLMFPALLILGLLGLVFGIIGFFQTRKFPDELTGRLPAILGSVLCAIVFVAGTATHSVIYATEVPDGYNRISFNSLKSNGEGPDVPPPEALDLNGEQVFLKGYMYPDGQKHRVKRFVLVPDLGTCCFGGQPKLTHMVQVTLTGALNIDYSLRARRLAGTLTVDQSLKPVSGVNGVYYELTANYVK